MTGTPSSASVTTIISRRVRPGESAQYERLLHEIIEAAAGVPGHLGAEVVRPADHEGEYHTIFRFADAEGLQAWLDSAERRRLQAALDGVADTPATTRRIDGMEAWLTPPGQVLPPRAPPRYKTAVLVWAGLVPTIYAFTLIVGPFLEEIPAVVRPLVIATVTTPVMTWLVLPVITRLLGSWLRDDRS